MSEGLFAQENAAADKQGFSRMWPELASHITPFPVVKSGQWYRVRTRSAFRPYPTARHSQPRPVTLNSYPERHLVSANRDIIWLPGQMTNELSKMGHPGKQCFEGYEVIFPFSGTVNKKRRVSELLQISACVLTLWSWAFLGQKQRFCLESTKENSLETSLVIQRLRHLPHFQGRCQFLCILIAVVITLVYTFVKTLSLIPYNVWLLLYVSYTSVKFIKKKERKTSPSNVAGAGLIPAQGAKTPHTSWP